MQRFALCFSSLVLVAACSADAPPKPCEADSDCGGGMSCLRELPTLAPALATTQLKRAPKEVCVPNRTTPLLTGFNAGDGRVYVGAAKVDISPRGFETHININDPVRCPHNQPNLFEGYIDAPGGTNDPMGDSQNPCLEAFNDTNGNGYFDAAWIGGFDNARAATGIDEEAPIMARTMVLAQGGEHFAIISLDVVGVGPPAQEELRKILHTQLGLDRNHVLIHATHNHEGPDIIGLWGPTVVHSANEVARAIVTIAGGDLGTFNKVPIRPGMGDDYWPFVEGKVLESVRAAMANMRPAKLRFVQPEAPMKSRDIVVGGRTINVDDIKFDHEDVQLPDFNGDGIINDEGDISTFQGGAAGRLLMTDIKLPHIMDRTISALQAVDADSGQTLATFVNWTNHVEATSSGNTKLTADYAGYLCNYVERTLGGVAVFTAGTVGGLQTQLRDVWVPKLNEAGEFLAADNRVVATMAEAGKALNDSYEKAKGLGRVIGRTAVEALRAAPFATLAPLKVKTRYAWIPLDNPYFYIGARLGILAGLLEWITGTKRTDVFALGSRVAACGGAGCLRTDIVLADFGPLRIVSAPGELYPEYVVGRAASSFRYGGTRMAKYADVNQNGIPDVDEPQILVNAGKLDMEANLDTRQQVRVGFPLNPQRFTAITGLRPEDKRVNNTQALIVVGLANNSIGYLIPESDHINRFEGFLDGIGSYVSLLGPADLRVMLDLKVSEPVILREFIEDTIRRFSAVLADLPGIDLETHVNQNGDENSTGRRTGNIVYNTMCELLEGGTCATPLPVDPNPHTSTLPRAP